MKVFQNALLTALLASSVLAYADDNTSQQTNNNVDSKKEVAYMCAGGEGGKQKVSLLAMYGIKDGDVVVAQVKIGNNTSPGMWRVADTLLNRFVSNDDANSYPTMWTTLPATADDVDKVDGGKLSYAEDDSGVQTVIVEKCKLDKEATAKLNR